MTTERQHTLDDAVTLETAMIRFGIRNDLNCTGEPRMTTERQHTLVPCANCGTGDQPKYMVLAGKTWLCTQCAGAEIGRLHTWDGLMSLVNEHYPEDIFPTLPDTKKRDPGPRIISLLRTVDSLRTALGKEQP